MLDLKDQINELVSKKGSRGAGTYLRAHLDSNIAKEILRLTPFLSPEHGWSERIYCALNGISAVPTCRNCGKKLDFKSFEKGYRDFCSHKCAFMNKDIVLERNERRKETSKKLYGSYTIKGLVPNSNKLLLKYANLDLKEALSLLIKENGYRKVVPAIRCNPLDTMTKKLMDRTAYLETASVSERIFHVLNDLFAVQLCPVCHKPIKFNKHLRKYFAYCSSKCFYSIPENKEKILEKTKNTWLTRYGVDSPLKDKRILEKVTNTTRARYGVDNVFQNADIKKKIAAVNLEKYGVEHAIQNEEIKNKIIKKSRHSAYVNLLNSDRLISKVSPCFKEEEYSGVAHTSYKFKCNQCGTIFERYLSFGRIPRCPVCFPTTVSKHENDIYEWLKTFHITNIERHDRKLIPPWELDIYLPDYKLAIEFNGVYWHSELNGGKDKNYHLNKTIECERKGIHLMHIFEDEWIKKQDIVKSIILNKLGIFSEKIDARECEIKTVAYEDACKFLDANHIRGASSGGHIFGLYYNNNLVDLIILAIPKLDVNSQFELIRSCSKINTQIVGGFDRLIEHASKVLNTPSIVSYVDRRYFLGSYYSNWKFIGTSDPNYFYVKNFKSREDRNNYKHKVINTKEDEKLTEWQLMQAKGYDRIWDCGNLIFVHSKIQGEMI